MRIAVVTLLLLLSAWASAQLEGFKLDGTRWTYTQGDWKIQGIFVKPDGKGPFPALLVSHGKGSNAERFAKEKAREFAMWGVATIAVDYAHSGTSTVKGQDGASPENIKRALKCLEILRSMKDIDGKRIAAYGNSMGAFLTIALSAEPEAKLVCSIISAGGISGAKGFPAPDAETARKIKIPMLMFHGEKDNVVPAQRSEELKKILDENKVENRRRTYPDGGHNVHASEESDVYANTKGWLIRHKVILPP